MKRILTPLLLSLVLLCSTGAQELPSNMKEVLSLAGITEYRMDNGMKVLLFPDPSSPKTTVNITYLVGSRHEGYGETGMAHLLEHMLFKGTPDHTNIPQELTEHGAQANGTTWYDRTNYYETFPSSDENLNWALSLESDRMINSYVAKKDLDSEMTVVRNEFERGENSPTGILNERVFSTAYLWHNYGQSTIGARSDIENVPIDRLQAFYHKYYQPDNAVLIVAGKFEPGPTLKLISEKFGAIPRPTRTLPGTYTAEPTQDGERIVELRRTGDTKVVALAYHVPAGSDPGFAAVDVLGEILSDTPSGRLYKKLVTTKLATDVGGGAYQLHDPSLLYLQASTTKDGDLLRLQKALIEVAQSFSTEPPTEEEVERARTALLKSMEKVQRDSRSLALQLSEWEAMGDWRLFFLYNERLKNVTVADVTEAAARYLKTSNRTVGLFIPEESPERAEIAELDLDAMEKALGELKLEEGLSQGEDFDPTPKNIAERTTFFTLSNGVEVAFLPRKTRGETVSVRVGFDFGNEEILQGKGPVAAFTGAMLMKGTESMTREEIKDALIELSASGSVSGSYSYVLADFDTTRDNLPEVLKLSADMMKNPTFPAEELDTMRASYLADLDESKTNVNVRASQEINQKLDPWPKGDPRAETTIDEDIAAAKAVTLEEMKEFHRQFYGGNRGQIAVVGDFEPEEIKPLLEELFAGWNNEAAPSYKRLTDKVKVLDSGSTSSVFIPDKSNAVYYAVLHLPIDDENPDYAALRLGNYILGGGFLNSRLATRIRQKEGLSYSVGSSLSAPALDPAGSFSVYAIAAPENVEKVTLAVREELDRVLKDGFTPEEVEAAKKGYLESLKVARAQDDALSGLLTSYMEIDRDVMWLDEWDKKIQSLTPEQLHEAFKKHIDPDKLTIVTAGTLPQK
ncbi:MAG: insulinase family protein [Candidatus Eremiobacteraeota bacterium]|nr:insulinase family protein [Candidatus Eremiobacteraeota bacterium]